MTCAIYEVLYLIPFMRNIHILPCLRNEGMQIMELQQIQGTGCIEVILRWRIIPSLEFSVNSLHDCFPSRYFCKTNIKMSCTPSRGHYIYIEQLRESETKLLKIELYKILVRIWILNKRHIHLISLSIRPAFYINVFLIKIEILLHYMYASSEII